MSKSTMGDVVFVNESQIPTLDSQGVTDQEKSDRLQEKSAAMFAAVTNAPNVTPGSKAEEIVKARQSKAVAEALAALFATQN